MKRIMLFIMTLLVLSSSKAQTNADLETQVLQATSQLDLSACTSDIFINQTPSYIEPSYFDGLQADSAILTATNLNLLYGMLDKGYINTSPMLSTESFWQNSNEFAQADTIELAGLYYQYHQFKPTAIEDGLIEWSGTHFKDISGLNETPYEQKELYAFSALRNQVFTKTLTFHFDAAHFYSNINASLIDYEIDYDDGNGWQPLLTNHYDIVVYPDTGNYIIKVRKPDTSNGFLESHTLVRIEESVNNLKQNIEQRGPGGYNPTAPEGHQFIGTVESTYGPFGGPQQITCCGVDVYWWYGSCDGDGKIRKPLIILEGFDPLGTFTWESQLYDLEKKGLLARIYDIDNPIPLKDRIHLEEYDLFFIDYINGTDSIQNNAAHVQAAIEWINEQKGLNGSEEKNVVMGMSMGGLVGQWALSTMETEGIDHETELFITFDSPLKGGNVSLGVQAMSSHIAEYKLFGRPLRQLVSSLDEIAVALSSPAAKQMLYYHTEACPFPICEGDELSVWHDAFLEEFEQKTISIPQISISNGALDGTDPQKRQGFEASAKVLEEHLTLNEFLNRMAGFSNFASTSLEVLGYAIATTTSLNLKLWALPDGDMNWVYDGAIETNILGINFQDRDFKVVNGTLPYDSASGGMFEFNPPDVDDNPRLPLNFSQKFHCFTPTASALNLDVPHPYTDLSNAGQIGLHAYFAINEPITTSEATFYNEEHITFNRQSVEFLMAHISDIDLPSNGLPDANVLENTIYNFGVAASVTAISSSTILQTPKIINLDITVKEEGELWVNRNDKIAFTNDSNNLQNQTQSDYELYIQENICTDEATLVHLHSTGEMRVGQWTSGIQNKAKVHVQKNAAILIEREGKMQLNNHSKLIIEEGGRVDIGKNGFLINGWNTEIRVAKGGILRIHDGGTLRTKFNGKVIVEEGGQLILDRLAKVELWDATNSAATIHIEERGELVINGAFKFDGSGFFQFDKGHILTLNHDFILRGKEKGHRFIRLNDGAELKIEKYGLQLSNGKVEYQSASKIIAYPQTRINFIHTEFSGSGSATGLLSQAAWQVDIYECLFTGLYRGLEILGSPTLNGSTIQSLSPRIVFSDFLDNQENIYLFGTGGINIYDSTIEGGNLGIYAYDVRALNFVRSSIRDFGTPNASPNSLQGAFVLDRVNTLTLDRGIVEGNDVGVYGSEQAQITQINVFKSQIRGNRIGIEMYGGLNGWNGLNYGGLLVACSHITGNADAGVFGKDILLGIHAPDPHLGSNNFRHSKPARIFDIRYQAYNIGNTVLAHHNYWGDDCPIAIEEYSLKYHPGGGYITLDTGPTCDKLYECVTVEEEDSPEEPHPCREEIDFRGIKKNIHDLMTQGFVELFEGNRKKALQYLQPLVNISADKVKGMEGICRTDIYFAGLITSKKGKEKTMEDSPLFRLANIQSDIAIYPNPADTEFTIEVGEGNYTVRVFNTLGQLVEERTLFGKTVVATGEWERGLYFVELVDVDSGERFLEKVLVE